MKKLDLNLEKFFKKYSYNVNKVVGIDPFDFGNIYLLEDGVLSRIKLKDIKQEHIVSSYIPNKNVITYELKLQKNLLDKIELDDYIETKCYEEIGLDEAEEYIFKYKVIDSLADEKYIIAEVVIITKSDIEELYEPFVKKTGYLDFITYSGYAFNVLYKEKILEPQNDLYIYFTKNDIFITLYSEGKFLQTFAIPEGLQNIYEELVESIKIKNFDFDKFMQLLVKKGLDLNNYSEKEQVLFNELSEIFSNKFLIISNQLHSIIRKFSLTTIDRIFMSTIRGSIVGISEFANMYLGVEANDLDFGGKYKFNTDIDQILFLSMLYAQYAYKSDDQVDNFTTFYRPPTFFYRKSGQFIATTVASLLISIAYPAYQAVYTAIIEGENQIQQSKLNKLNSINRNLKAQNKKLENIKKQKEKMIAGLKKYIKDRETIIDTMYKEKVGYIPKSILIADLTKYLYSNKVYLRNIEYGDKLRGKVAKQSKQTETSGYLVLDVYAKDNKNITKFIDELVNKEHLIVTTPGYVKINNFYSAKIIIKVEE